MEPAIHQRCTAKWNILKVVFRKQCIYELAKVMLLRALWRNTNPQPDVLKRFHKPGQHGQTTSSIHIAFLQNDQCVHSSVRGALNEATAWEIFVRNFEDNIKLDRHERTANLENGLNYPTTGYNGHILWTLQNSDSAQECNFLHTWTALNRSRRNLCPWSWTRIFFPLEGTKQYLRKNCSNRIKVS